MAWKIHWIKSVLSTVGKGNFYDKFWGNRQLQVEHLRVVECCVVWGVSEPSTKFETRESRQLWVGTAAIIVSCQSARIKSNIPLIPFVISILKCYLGLRGLQRVIGVNSILWISRSEITRGRAGEGKRGQRRETWLCSSWNCGQMWECHHDQVSAPVTPGMTQMIQYWQYSVILSDLPGPAPTSWPLGCLLLSGSSQITPGSYWFEIFALFLIFYVGCKV